MKTNTQLTLTTVDAERLEQLLDSVRGTGRVDTASLKRFEDELDRAEIVEPREVPANVITMDSRVVLRDMESGQELTYRLVYPHRADSVEHGLSILAPVGMALIGYRQGDLIEWPVPRGVRRLRVLNVLDQPEARRRSTAAG